MSGCFGSLRYRTKWSSGRWLRTEPHLGLATGDCFSISLAIFSPYRAALTAAWLYAIEPLSVLYTSKLLTDTWFATLLLLSMYFLIGHLKVQRTEAGPVTNCLFISAVALAGTTLASIEGRSYYDVQKSLGYNNDKLYFFKHPDHKTRPEAQVCDLKDCVKGPVTVGARLDQRLTSRLYPRSRD